MFEPKSTTRRFDRNIFNNQGKSVTLNAKHPVNLLYFYLSNVVVGQISGKIKALVYEGFKRGDWYPVQIFIGDTDYCGWVKADEVEGL